MRKFIVLCVVLCGLLATATEAPAINKEIDQAKLKPFEIVIQIHEYNCPCAALGFYKGDFPKGQKFKIFCGPDETHANPNLAYEVILSPDMETVMKDTDNSQVFVKPWKN